jgi:16S rRNA (guanine966-N2)-methyltransferase
VTRPTGDRVRETLFSMLASRLGSFDGLSVVDLFAGSGAQGLEALSRGASFCLFVERDQAALAAIRRNIEMLDCRTRTQVHAGSANELGPAKQPHDLLLVDPPYRTGAGEVALDRLARLGWIGPESWATLETHADEEPKLRRFCVEAERKVGSARLHILKALPVG